MSLWEETQRQSQDILVIFPVLFIFFGGGEGGLFYFFSCVWFEFSISCHLDYAEHGRRSPGAGGASGRAGLP